ncbi:hypothetical protein CON70_24720 [Bacillus pseudomycoides]|nr:hypothetical protein CON70_24720 [Bacillus pseudomycoides]
MKYPLNEIFLSLQLVILRSQLIFLFLGVFTFLKLMDVWCYPMPIKLRFYSTPKTQISSHFFVL